MLILSTVAALPPSYPTSNVLARVDKPFKFASTGIRLLLPVLLIPLLLGGKASHAQTAKYYGVNNVQGFSQPARISVVASGLNGVIQSLEATAGMAVDQGQCLAKLDQAVHQQRLNLARIAMDAEAEIDIARMQLAAKADRLERIRGLRDREHATATEFLQAQQDHDLARATLRRAEEDQAKAKAEYQRLVAESQQYCIRAPYDGVLVEFKKQVGEYVGPADPAVCVVADLSQLSVEFLAPPAEASLVTIGQTVTVQFIESGSQVDGTVHYVSPFPHGETGTFTIKVTVDNADRTLTAGQRCLLLNPPTRDSAAAARTSSLPADPDFALTGKG